jgi:hypothetical protein
LTDVSWRGTQILVTSIFSLVAAIVAAFTVHWLTRSREHEIWVRDRKMNEWKELIGALATAHVSILGTKTTLRAPDERRRLRTEAEATLARIASDRIFIADDLAKIRFWERWTHALRQCDEQLDHHPFTDEYLSLRDSIVKAAKSD